MSEPYVGQLMLVGFNFAPVGWATASGQILPISQNTALFSLLGTIYGGNGTSNFALPNLQGNVAIGFGQGPGLSNYLQGETGGSQTVTLLASQAPSHTHTPMATNRPAQETSPANHAFAETEGISIYSTASSSLTAMSPAAISTQGGSQPHNNMMPFLGMYWIIAMQGVFPARS